MSTGGEPEVAPDPTGRLLLGLAAVAVAFAAADTYVVVLALPEMMAASGLSAEDLQRAAPIISGFMLGYVGALPLVGRIADLRGRLPVLVGSLVVFSLGSLVTAAAYDLNSMVTGRVLQGIGGGGLLPATLALVADLYPPDETRPAPRRRQRHPGARQRARAAVRRRGARPRHLARHLRDQPRGRAGAGGRHPPHRRAHAHRPGEVREERGLARGAAGPAGRAVAGSWSCCSRTGSPRTSRWAWCSSRSWAPAAG